MIEGRSTPPTEADNLPSPDPGMPPGTEAPASPEHASNSATGNGDLNPEEQAAGPADLPSVGTESASGETESASGKTESASGETAESAGAEAENAGAETESAPSVGVEAETPAADAVAEQEPDVLEEEGSASPAMTEPGFAELLEQSLERARPINVGDRLRAVVQRIEDEVSFLDYGGPSEAVWGNELWKGIDRNAGGE